MSRTFPVLIHSPPEIVAFTVNREKHLIQMPFVAWAEVAGAAIGSHAEARAVIEPDPIADDLGRETVVFVRGRLVLVYSYDEYVTPR